MVVASDALLRAQELLALEDVYIRNAHALTHPEYDPVSAAGDPPEYLVQIQHGVSKDVKTIAYEQDAQTQHRIVYAVETRLRLVKPNVAEQEEPSEDDVVAMIAATFLVRYLVRGNDSPEKGLLDAFAVNAVHHMWPYWREFLQASAARLRVPPIVLPVRPPRKKPAEAAQPAKA